MCSFRLFKKNRWLSSEIFRSNWRTDESLEQCVDLGQELSVVENEADMRWMLIIAFFQVSWYLVLWHWLIRRICCRKLDMYILKNLPDYYWMVTMACYREVFVSGGFCGRNFSMRGPILRSTQSGTFGLQSVFQRTAESQPVPTPHNYSVGHSSERHGKSAEVCFVALERLWNKTGQLLNASHILKICTMQILPSQHIKYLNDARKTSI